MQRDYDKKHYSKPFYKKKEVRVYLEDEYIVRLTEANHKSVYYKEISTGDTRRYNISFDMMIGIGYGCGVWKDSGRGFLTVTGMTEDWRRFYSLIERNFDEI